MLHIRNLEYALTKVCGYGKVFVILAIIHPLGKVSRVRGASLIVNVNTAKQRMFVQGRIDTTRDRHAFRRYCLTKTLAR